MHALAHLRAAMIHLHRPILIDQDQRSSLVEVGHREADAELHRRHGKAAFGMRMRVVPIPEFSAAAVELARLFKFAPNRSDPLISDFLSVMSGVSLAPAAIKIAFPH